MALFLVNFLQSVSLWHIYKLFRAASGAGSWFEKVFPAPSSHHLLYSHTDPVPSNMESLQPQAGHDQRSFIPSIQSSTCPLHLILLSSPLYCLHNILHRMLQNNFAFWPDDMLKVYFAYISSRCLGECAPNSVLFPLTFFWEITDLVLESANGFF